MIHYIERDKYVLADSLLRCLCLPTPTELGEAVPPVPLQNETGVDELNTYFIDDELEAFHPTIENSWG